MNFLSHDKPHFLQPAHDHDPAEVSGLTDLATSESARLPDEVRELLPAVCEATSIVFASVNRLHDLLSQRLVRLTLVAEENKKPGVAKPQYSEPAYFWYQNQVTAEAQYLMTEAYTDWKHKATRIEQRCICYGITLDLHKAETPPNMEFAKWFQTLREEVEEWKRIANAIEVPDFHQAVEDLIALQDAKKSPTAKPATVIDAVGEAVMGKIEKIDSGIVL